MRDISPMIEFGYIGVKSLHGNHYYLEQVGFSAQSLETWLFFNTDIKRIYGLQFLMFFRLRNSLYG